jgi:hypothetical protein
MHPLHDRQKRELVAGRVVLGIDPGKKRHTAWMLDTDGLPLGRAFSFSVDHGVVAWPEMSPSCPCCQLPLTPQSSLIPASQVPTSD